MRPRPIHQALPRRRRHQHQKINLEPASAHTVNSLAQGVVAAEEIGGHEDEQGCPWRRRHELRQKPANQQQRTAQGHKNKFRLRTKYAAMLMIVCFSSRLMRSGFVLYQRQSHVLKGIAQSVFISLPSIKFNPQRPLGIGLGLYNPGDCAAVR